MKGWSIWLEEESALLVYLYYGWDHYHYQTRPILLWKFSFGAPQWDNTSPTQVTVVARGGQVVARGGHELFFLVALALAHCNSRDLLTLPPPHNSMSLDSAFSTYSSIALFTIWLFRKVLRHCKLWDTGGPQTVAWQSPMYLYILVWKHVLSTKDY